MSQTATKPSPVQGGEAKVRVLPKGAGMLFTGELEDGVFTTHPKGAVLTVAPAQARELEDRGLVEIL
jgi:hypothetical protein